MVYIALNFGTATHRHCRTDGSTRQWGCLGFGFEWAIWPPARGDGTRQRNPSSVRSLPDVLEVDASCDFLDQHRS